MFFRMHYLKLRNFYNKITKSYIICVVRHPFHFIFIYLLVTLILSCGLFQLSFNLDTESLTYVRNSKAIENAHLINKTYHLDQHKRFFINKILDLGHYVEIIVCKKVSDAIKRESNEDLLKPEYNLINQTVLNDFNRLYDTIINIEIDDGDLQSGSRNKTLYKYTDLCGIRLGKCAIEGSLARNPSFQKKLLQYKVDYQPKDPKTSFGDTDSVDGFSIKVLFGKYKKELLIDEELGSYYGARYAIIHAGTFRIRFELLSSNEKETQLSRKFMLKFAQIMHTLDANNTFKHLNFSYYTSQLMSHEIQIYSKPDVKYLIWFIGLFFVCFSVAMWLNSSSSYDKRLRNRNNFSNEEDSNSNSKNRFIFSRYFAKFCFLPSSICINGASFLPLCFFIQFFLSILATFGTVSLFDIEPNPIAMTMIVILMSKLF
jgi:hypothetical protein